MLKESKTSRSKMDPFACLRAFPHSTWVNHIWFDSIYEANLMCDDSWKRDGQIEPSGRMRGNTQCNRLLQSWFQKLQTCEDHQNRAIQLFH